MNSRLLRQLSARPWRVKRVAALALVALEDRCDQNKQDDAEDTSLDLATRLLLVAALTTLLNQYMCSSMVSPRPTPVAAAPVAEPIVASTSN